ncbi:MAG: hypothetical protein QXS02_06710 [Candidatus Thermoplasmatota archaeon]
MVEENKEEGKMGHVSNLLERLQQASNELNLVKDTFSKSMSELEKIQTMLSADGIEKFYGILRDFEMRISEAERRRQEATEGAQRYSQELEKEKERLMKLWDAYKNQEEELSLQEKKALELEERARALESEKKQLEKDLTDRINTLTKKLEENEKKINDLDMYKQKAERFDEMKKQLEEKIEQMNRQILDRDRIITEQQNEITKLKQFESLAEYKNKYEELSKEYEKERDRLTKLFHLYEQTEAECNSLRKELNEWQSWFNQNEELFKKLFTSVEHLKKSAEQTTPTTTPEPVTVNKDVTTPFTDVENLSNEKKEEGEKRRIFRFRK